MNSLNSWSTGGEHPKGRVQLVCRASLSSSPLIFHTLFVVTPWALMNHMTVTSWVPSPSSPCQRTLQGREGNTKRRGEAGSCVWFVRSCFLLHAIIIYFLRTKYNRLTLYWHWLYWHWYWHYAEFVEFILLTFYVLTTVWFSLMLESILPSDMKSY